MDNPIGEVRRPIRWMDGLLDAICISLILRLSKGFLQRGHTTYCLAHLSHSSSQHMVYVSLLLSTLCDLAVG